MKVFLRRAIQGAYTTVAKPLLFRFSPDSVHEKTSQLAYFLQRWSLVRWVAAGMLGHRSPVLEQNLFDRQFVNPVGLSAGFDKNVELAPLMESIGFGFVTGGSVTGYACAGNEKPWFHRLPESKSIVVHAGLPNRGSKAVARQLQNSTLVGKRTVPLTISVARTNSKKSSTDTEAIADYVLAATTLRDYADIFELNISCPNTYGGEPFTEPGRLSRLLDAIDALSLEQPIWVKMPSNLPWDEYDALLQVIVEHGIDAVTVSNLRKDRTGVVVDPSIKGNLSGKPTQQLSDDLIKKTYTKYGKRLTIIGVGGIFTAEDAYQKIKNGASLVALVTGLIYEGPQVVGQINQGLERLLRADGYTSVSQAIGVATKGSHGRK